MLAITFRELPWSTGIHMLDQATPIISQAIRLTTEKDLATRTQWAPISKVKLHKCKVRTMSLVSSKEINMEARSRSLKKWTPVLEDEVSKTTWSFQSFQVWIDKEVITISSLRQCCPLWVPTRSDQLMVMDYWLRVKLSNSFFNNNSIYFFNNNRLVLDWTVINLL